MQVALWMSRRRALFLAAAPAQKTSEQRGSAIWAGQVGLVRAGSMQMHTY